MAIEEMEQMIRGLGDQLRWASDLETESISIPGSLIVAGMGGSGISGDLLGVMASVPVTVHKSYGLPGWANSRPRRWSHMSYSGNTEETLSAVEAARSLGLASQWSRRAEGWGRWQSRRDGHSSRCPAGSNPGRRSGTCWGRCCEWSGRQPISSPAISGLPPTSLTQITQGLGRDLAADLAAGVRDRIPISTGPRVSRPDRPALEDPDQRERQMARLVHVIPELDHNEIVSWTSLSTLTSRHLGSSPSGIDSEPDQMNARFAHTSRADRIAMCLGRRGLVPGCQSDRTNNEPGPWETWCPWSWPGLAGSIPCRSKQLKS